MKAIEIIGATGSAAGVVSIDPPIIQRFKVECIRGNLQMFQSTAGTAGAVVIVGLGIVKASVTPPAPGSSVVLDPNAAIAAGTQWMYLRHWQIQESATAPNLNFTFEQKLPFGSDVMTRTKRIVRENEQILLYWSIVAYLGSSTATYALVPFLRTLITKVA